MRILYVSRDYSNLQLRRRLAEWRMRDRFNGQEGFFEASLWSAADVTRCTFQALRKKGLGCNGAFDALVVNYKSFAQCSEAAEALSFLRGITDVPKVLLVANAQAGNLPGEEFLDLFDLIFKREHYRDLDRYRISNANKAKLRHTMLSCPLVPARHATLRQVNAAAVARATRAPEPSLDVFFSGASTSPVRGAAWERITVSGFSYAGGLQPKPGADARTRRYGAPKLRQREYIELIGKARVNLALEGYGAFTYRHLELWCLGAFMLSSANIEELALPIDAVEGEHYIGFRNLDDMIEKIRHYAARPEERERIAAAGRALFERDYDFTRHGAYIRRAIEGVA